MLELEVNDQYDMNTLGYWAKDSFHGHYSSNFLIPAIRPILGFDNRYALITD